MDPVMGLLAAAGFGSMLIEPPPDLSGLVEADFRVICSAIDEYRHAATNGEPDIDEFADRLEDSQMQDAFRWLLQVEICLQAANKARALRTN